MTEGKYIIFAEGEPKARTKTWRIYAKADMTLLGNIQWWARWRQYTFFPLQDRVFEKQCLRDIAAFCENETKEQNNRARQNRLKR